MVVGSADSSEERSASLRAVALDGSASVWLCTVYCIVSWESTGKSAYIVFPGADPNTYVVPVAQNGLPKVPSGLIGSKDDLPHAKQIPWIVESALNPLVYADTRENTRRNLYRIPLR